MFQYLYKFLLLGLGTKKLSLFVVLGKSIIFNTIDFSISHISLFSL